MLCFQVNKGTYELPQAGLLAQKRLITDIAEHGYTQSDVVLLHHATNGVTFALVVCARTTICKIQTGFKTCIRNKTKGKKE
jgi:hypothetical protein